MKYVPGLIKRKLKDWTGKQWYHQRFDGCPYFIHYIAEAEIVTHEDRKLGGDCIAHYCFFSEGKADWYIELKDMEKVYSSLIQAGKKNANISTEMMKQWQPDEEKFYDKCREIHKTDLAKLNDTELMRLHDDFLQITLNRNSSSSIIDGFALGTDQILADMLKAVHEKSKFKEQMRFTELFSILTAPVHLSFINEAEVALLKLALDIPKNPAHKEKLLAEHQKKYFWIRNNYVDAIILDTKYFEDELDKLKPLGHDIKKEIGDIIKTPTVSKQKKEQLMGQLQLDDELKLLIRVSEDFTQWQDERKKATFWTAHYFCLILEEIARRIQVPVNELKYLSPREVSKIFETKPDRKILQERMKNSVFYWDKEGHEAVHGKDCDHVKDAILGKTDLSDVNDFRGLTASLGVATGKVKVVKSAKEINKVEQGDILVAVMTRPDYVPAMKKAAAIVTEEGGVTSHAAIVSRELKIPCIIGTKIATKVLKDGDEVQVDANHGVVKIVKRA